MRQRESESEKEKQRGSSEFWSFSGRLCVKGYVTRGLPYTAAVAPTQYPAPHNTLPPFLAPFPLPPTF